MTAAPTDEQLMADYAHGSDRAFEELFQRYEARMWAFLRRRAASEADARDLYQELFLRLHRFRHTYDPMRPFAPWLFQLARNVAVDAVRRTARRAEVSLPERLADRDAPSAERSAVARERLERALGRLSPEEVRVVVEAKLRGREYAELAAELGKSLDAVKQLAARALRKARTAPGAAT